MLIRRAEIEGAAPRDVRLAGGRIAEIAPSLTPRPGEEVFDAAGGALIPGLHDHHIHLLALAAARTSTRCGPPAVRDAEALARALREAPRTQGWVRGVGYHESVAGELDRARLDALAPDSPVRVQHRSGALWMLNSGAIHRLGLDRGVDAAGVERDARGRATGRLFRLDAWLRERLGMPAPDLAPVGRALARVGVTGVTDATATNGVGALALLTRAVALGALPQRVVVMGTRALERPVDPRISRGALKLLLDERELPSPEALACEIAAAHRTDRGVAVHCVTRAELVVAATAFGLSGARPGDRIEHASVAPPDVVELLAALDLTVVTQPHFVFERGDTYAREVEARDRSWLYRGRGFLEAGIPLGGGTDAPFGEPDPWLAMRAAVERRTREGRVLGEGEALSPERALALFTTPPEQPGGLPRRLHAGAPADLCLLARPWREAREHLDRGLVVGTFRDGHPIAP